MWVVGDPIICSLIAIVYIDSYYAMNMIHATNIWMFMLLILGIFIECWNRSDFKMDVSNLPMENWSLHLSCKRDGWRNGNKNLPLFLNLLIRNYIKFPNWILLKPNLGSKSLKWRISNFCIFTMRMSVRVDSPCPVSTLLQHCGKSFGHVILLWACDADLKFSTNYFNRLATSQVTRLTIL